MKVLSLFDGISCGRLALERAGIDVEVQDAYEIDETAIQISKKNWNDINYCGDVFSATYEEGQYDLLIGGSPCTYWSIARSNAGREVESSGLGWELFQQYVRAKSEVKPKWFLYENNYSMSKDIKNEITKALGVRPVLINSSSFSAQNRKRLYWTNIPLGKIPEIGTPLLRDILTSGTVDRDKSLCVAARTTENYGTQEQMRKRQFGKSFAQMVFEGTTAEEQKELWRAGSKEERGTIRVINIKEMERLQTLPDDYTDVEGISRTLRGKAIGNGWTVDVIAFILRELR